jgi:dTMP kinase
MSGRLRKPRSGLFVVLEGLDGAGTTTQLERLSAALRADGHKVVATREPSDGPVGTLLRQALSGRVVLPDGRGAPSDQTLALLFAADRVDHLEAQVLPALDSGAIVICDRYVLSSLAYQGASLPPSWVEAINVWAVPADLTLFLEVNPGLAERRRTARGARPELFETSERQRRIAKEYGAAVKRRTKAERVVKLDGSRPVEEVTQAALSAIRKRIR